MKVLFVASECAPIAKVGGLADVIGSLPKALQEIGVDVSVLIPFYGVVNLKSKEKKIVLKEADFNLWQTFLTGSKVPLFLIENNNYFQGDVYIEADASSGGTKKEAERFLFLSKTAIKTAKFLKIDIIHCHDWHTAIIPFLLKRERPGFKNLLTIHNLQYQGVYPSQIVNQMLNADFNQEYVNCLKEGIVNAKAITTVSPSYAKEIITPEYGCGLEKFLKERGKDLIGILNGLDTETFNPQKDLNLKTNYSVGEIERKEENKAYIQKKCFGRVEPGIPLLGMVGRLTEQKGIDLIQEIFPSLMKEKIQFILLGTGVKKFELFFEEKNKKFPQKFWAKIGFDESLARQIYAGSDIFLMPSCFEPCGLGQLISMAYGTLPIVRKTGGLTDTVEDGKTGFVFEKYSRDDFLICLKRALKIYQDKKEWQKLMRRAMKKDFSWKSSAQKYLNLYKKLTLDRTS